MTSVTGDFQTVPGTLRNCTWYTRGFSLLEILITVAILIITVTLAAVSFSGMTREKELTTPILELQKISKQASRAAATSHTPHVLKILPKAVEAQRFDREGNAVAVKTIHFPPNGKVSIQPFGMTKWIAPEKQGYLWFFEPSGLCEPLGIKLEIGKSFYSVAFDPLTGGVADERMVVLD